MTVTKEEVAARAKELSLTLTETEVEQFVKDGRLPEKQSFQQRKEELKGLSSEQMIERIIELSGEARDRRLEVKEYKQRLEEVTKEFNQIKEIGLKYPEMEKQFNATQEILKGIKESEKKRREATILKLGKEKAEKLAYLTNTDLIPADQFDSTLELFSGNKSNGAEAPTPGGGDPPKVTLTQDQKREADRMGLSEAEFADVNAKRKPK